MTAYRTQSVEPAFPKTSAEPQRVITLSPGREKLSEQHGIPTIRGKDRAALRLLRDRLASVENGSYAPRELEVDIHRYFFRDYLLRKRGEWLAKCWTGGQDFDFDHGEPSLYWAYWHLGLFKIPRYASDTETAFRFSRSCFVQHQLLTVREIKEEMYGLWRAELMNEQGGITGSGQHATLAVATMLAVLEAVAQHGTAWDSPPNPGNSDG